MRVSFQWSESPDNFLINKVYKHKNELIPTLHKEVSKIIQCHISLIFMLIIKWKYDSLLCNNKKIRVCIETNIKAMVNLFYVLTKVWDYWLVAGIGCSARCPITDVSLRVNWLGGPCVIHFWKWRIRSTVTPYCSNGRTLAWHLEWWHWGYWLRSGPYGSSMVWLMYGTERNGVYWDILQNFLGLGSNQQWIFGVS